MIQNNLLHDLSMEMNRATTYHSGMNSAHEGYAVILEEMDELWDEIKKNPHNPKLMRKEAIHVATMAIRFVMDVCPNDRDKEEGENENA